jgi:uncharacterized coiled-coil DUF342 family protein
LSRPRKGCPKPIPIPLTTIHIQRRDYDNVVYKREYPNQPIHEILHKIFAKLENLQEEVGSLREEVKDIRLELDEYRRFIKAKGLEEELSKILIHDMTSNSLGKI